ncbi:MAG TPA: type VI secretion system-associated FHA domain protein TagH [Thauera phenylacetica]|jgi:FHA domain-containing protein|nr:type VI secretion system-associated FHA domain protein TagH [Thauera phenylacetica]
MEGALPAVYDETVAAPARVLGHGGFLGHAGGIVQMIRIRVLSLDGSAPAQPAQAEFDEAGGTIGRAESNDLVLDDPDRHVSRVQARVECGTAGCRLTNLGTNPVDVDGRSLSTGEPAALRAGARIVIGRYVLEALDLREAASSSPGPAMAASAPASEPVSAASDPLGLFGAGIGQARADDPFAEFLSPPPSAPTVPPRAAGNSAAQPGGVTNAAGGSVGSMRGPATGARPLIPDDFDPFAEPMEPPPAARPSPPPALDELGFGARGPETGEAGISTMFGLGPTKRDPALDPFAGTPLAEPAAASSAAAQAAAAVPLDPLDAMFDAPAKPVPAAPLPDHVPELDGSFRPPAAAPNAPQDAFLSWDAERSPAVSSGAPAVRQRGEAQFRDAAAAMAPVGEPAATSGTGAGAPQPPQGAPQPPADVHLEALGGAGPSVPVAQASSSAPAVVAAPARAGIVPSTPPTASAPRSDESAALMRAFLSGLDISDPGLPAQPSPEWMQAIGRLLREATQGTLDLLLARAVVKREVRAEVTMIVSRGNNPLKFSPNVEVALSHLLAPRGQGFLSPVEAMRDAYGDLRAHEFGFMAGMRAALAGVLERFDPQALEARLSEPSMLDNLMPINRRARLWGLYTELYREIAREAEDDFQDLFGKAFLQAYEEQVRRMEAGEKDEDGGTAGS